MNKLIKTALAISIFIVAGCSSKAGPFVTNISSDGRGGITVEKCMVRLDRSINTVEASDCTNSNITLTNTSPRQ